MTLPLLPLLLLPLLPLLLLLRRKPKCKRQCPLTPPLPVPARRHCCLRLHLHPCKISQAAVTLPPLLPLPLPLTLLRCKLKSKS